jgi:hypothetical protein
MKLPGGTTTIVGQSAQSLKVEPALGGADAPEAASAVVVKNKQATAANKAQGLRLMCILPVVFRA